MEEFLMADPAREPSEIRRWGYQGSSDPGQPTKLMQPQTRPVPSESSQEAFEFPTTWEIEICERCGQCTEYSRDYGGPFPVSKCPFADCPPNTDPLYGTCPSVRTIVVTGVPDVALGQESHD